MRAKSGSSDRQRRPAQRLGVRPGNLPVLRPVDPPWGGSTKMAAGPVPACGETMRPEMDADAAWVRELSGKSQVAVERALEEARAQSRVFRYLVGEHDREGRPDYGEIDAPLELHALVRLGRPRHVVEVGVSSGVSSAYLLNALDLNRRGVLHSADLPSRPPKNRPARGRVLGSWSLPIGRHPGWAVPLRLKARWDLRIGDKSVVLPLLAEELPSVGLFVYDVPHDCSRARLDFRSLDPRLRKGSAVIVDHGPGGGLCPALRAWAERRGSTTVGRTNSGLHGMRLGAP
jgi:hypothetical protein